MIGTIQILIHRQRSSLMTSVIVDWCWILCISWASVVAVEGSTNSNSDVPFTNSPTPFHTSAETTFEEYKPLELEEPTDTSCFTYESPPSCHPPTAISAEFQFHDVTDRAHRTVNTACDQLDVDYLFWWGLSYETGLHVNALASLQANTTECAIARQVYHQCYWCASHVLPEPDLIDPETFCYPSCEDGPQFTDASVFPVPSELKQEVCHELELIYRFSYHGTIELCYLYEIMLYECDFFCETPEPVAYVTANYTDIPEPDDDSCFTYQDPPTCQHDHGESSSLATSWTYQESDSFFSSLAALEVNDICQKLDLAYMYNFSAMLERDVHVNALAPIRKNTSECQAARWAYPRCYWCATEVTSFSASEDESDDNIDHHNNDNAPPLSEDVVVMTDGFCFLSCDKDENATLPPALLNGGDYGVDEFCRDAEFWMMGLYQWPATIDACRLVGPILPWCDFWCGGGQRSTFSLELMDRQASVVNVSKTRTTAAAATPNDGQRRREFLDNLPNVTESSCFDPITNPPTCDRENDFDEVSLALNVQEECALLDQYFFGPYGIAFEHEYHVFALAGLQKMEPQCIRTRRVYHLCYFCRDQEPVTEPWCNMDSCRLDGLRNPGKLDSSIDTAATCQELEHLLLVEKQLPATTELCLRAEIALFSCDFWCNSYLGAKTDPQKRALVWFARVSAILSLGGAIYILYDIFYQIPHERTVYHELLVGIAVFDIVTALGWVVATTAIPRDEGWYIVGAAGSDGTCRAQAFMVQLGFTSVFYNVSLSLYYILVVVRGWRDGDLQRIRWYMHVCPVVVGLVLAILVIPFADWIGYGCHILPPPDGELWQSLVFVVLPIGFSIAFITAGMVYMYSDVRSKAKASQKWSFGVGSNRLETQVFWRALLYTLSFYATWPLLFAVYLVSLDYKVDSFVLSACVAASAPLQGFNNCLVYTRPRVARDFQKMTRQFSCLWDRRRGVTSTTITTSMPSSSLHEEPQSTKSMVDPSVAIVATTVPRRQTVSTSTSQGPVNPPLASLAQAPSTTKKTTTTTKTTLECFPEASHSSEAGAQIVTVEEYQNSSFRR